MTYSRCVPTAARLGGAAQTRHAGIESIHTRPTSITTLSGSRRDNTESPRRGRPIVARRDGGFARCMGWARAAAGSDTRHAQYVIEVPKNCPSRVLKNLAGAKRVPFFAKDFCRPYGAQDSCFSSRTWALRPRLSSIGPSALAVKQVGWNAFFSSLLGGTSRKHVYVASRGGRIFEGGRKSDISGARLWSSTD